MQLTSEQILENWNKHLKIVDTYIQSPRKELLIELFKDLEDKMVIAPASGKSHFHNAIPGGYIDHVNRVVEGAVRVKGLWEKMGADIDFTEEELVFAALCHDLGKIGDGKHECYVPQSNQWRRDNLNEQYTHNKELPFMLIPDRSLFILQSRQIPITHNEYLAIRIHDGVYDDANKAYFFSHSPESKLRTNIAYILHQADMMASKVEYDKWRLGGEGKSEEVKGNKKAGGKKELPGSDGLLGIVKNL